MDFSALIRKHTPDDAAPKHEPVTTASVSAATIRALDMAHAAIQQAILMRGIHRTPKATLDAYQAVETALKSCRRRLASAPADVRAAVEALRAAQAGS